MTFIEFFDKVASKNLCSRLTRIPERVVLWETMPSRWKSMWQNTAGFLRTEDTTGKIDIFIGVYEYVVSRLGFIRWFGGYDCHSCVYIEWAKGPNEA